MSDNKKFAQNFNILILGYPNDIKDSLLSSLAGKECDTINVPGLSNKTVRFIYYIIIKITNYRCKFYMILMEP